MQHTSEIQSTPMPSQGASVQDYYCTVFERNGDALSLTDSAASIPCDSPCGADCVRIIKNAGDMLHAIEAGIGDCGEYDHLRRVTTRVLNAFIDG